MEKKVHVKRRVKRRKVCLFCVEKWDVIDYKDTSKFRKFITERGKIFPRRNSGMCAKHQRVLAQLVKRARYMGLVPYCAE